MINQITHPKQLNNKAKSCTVYSGMTSFKVLSPSGNTYLVARIGVGINQFKCTCDWGKYRPSHTRQVSGCSHVQAVVKYLAALRQERTSAWGNEQDASRQHKHMINLGDGVIITTSKVGG